MKLTLKPFQEDTVAELVAELRAATQEGDRRREQAVVLSAPTGSGKTIIATAALEHIHEGDDTTDGDDRAVFLWITDQPELNEQTRDKMEAHSDVFGLMNLRIVDAAFDQRLFAPGTVYFLNTQKLATGNQLVRPGDLRQFTIWDTIRNTIAEHRGHFYVIIDEAHRGMTETARTREAAVTIIQKFIKGSDEIPAVPVILGISATPDRFEGLLSGTTRTTRRVNVDPDRVRESGLLKDVISLFHPDEDQPADVTLLRAAATAWHTYYHQWRSYCGAESEPPVAPILVVQVEDGSGDRLTRTDTRAAIHAIDDVIGPLPSEAYAHAFQEGTVLDLGGRPIRYLAPSQIQADRDVQVIFFKSSLNTGWDCPRAEVMMSYRKARDHTLIAQLVGRMVRTPLARRVVGNEHLNTVSLFLPHYDRAGLDKVVEHLTSDPDIVPPTTVERGENRRLLGRRSATERAFDAIGAIPTYHVPTIRKTSEVRRLLKLGRELTRDAIDRDAHDNAKTLLVSVLLDEREDRGGDAAFQGMVDELDRISFRQISVTFGSNDDIDESTFDIPASSENVDDLFAASGRRLGQGLHKEFWRRRVGDSSDRALIRQAKLECWALAHNTAVTDALESVARAYTRAWLVDHGEAIDQLPEGRRNAYDEVRRLASQPELVPMQLPDAIEVTFTGDEWDKHLYVDDADVYRAKLTSWEAAVIAEETARDDVIGWLRNIDRKDWALCIPYEQHGANKRVYPDFIVVRVMNSELAVDVLEPHNPDLPDSVAKAKGLATFARRHGHSFGRVEIIAIESDRVLRLDLNDEHVRDQVLRADTSEHLRALYRANG